MSAKAKVRKHSIASGKAFVRPEQNQGCRHGHVERLLRSRHQAFAECHAGLRSISYCEPDECKLTQLRRDLQREAELMDRNVRKGIRWLLLKHSENLDDSQNERVCLQEALDLNRPLAIAYYLKEDLSQIWKQSTKAVVAGFLTDWCRRARSSEIRALMTMANTLEGHRSSILNWYDYPISSGPLEGINNQIGALQRMPYGYQDTD